MVPCSIVELRQYTLRPGGRGVLVPLFERVFVESQEEAGIRLLGQFEDVERSDRFVWFRGFADLASRRAALARFYEGPVWAAHRDAANATMLDSDDVLLLRPLLPAGSFPRSGAESAAAPGARHFVVRVFHRAAGADLRGLCLERVGPALARAGAEVRSWLETHPGPNDFPRLPVREDADVVVCVSALPGSCGLEDHEARLAADPTWTRELLPALAACTSHAAERFLLRPTPRSALR